MLGLKKFLSFVVVLCLVSVNFNFAYAENNAGKFKIYEGQIKILDDRELCELQGLNEKLTELFCSGESPYTYVILYMKNNVDVTGYSADDSEYLYPQTKKANMILLQEANSYAAINPEWKQLNGKTAKVKVRYIWFQTDVSLLHEQPRAGEALPVTNTKKAVVSDVMTIKIKGDVSPYRVVIIDGSAYLPLRSLANALGCDVEYDGANRIINITTGAFSFADNYTTSLYGERTAIFTDDMRLFIDNVEFSDKNSICIIDASTYLPVRKIGKAVGATVDWDGINKIININ